MTQSSSVLFSLRELERMEEERVRALREAAEHHRARREQAQREAAEQARGERRAQEEAEAQGRLEIERRAREDAARIEAIHRASAEAARVSAEAKVRAEEREAERLHELELERTRAAARGSRGRSPFAGALFGAALAGAAAVALHYGMVAPQARARATEADALLASRDAAMAELRARADATDARARALEDDLQASRGRNDQLRAELEAARKPVATHGPAPRWTGVAPRADTPALNGFTSCAPGSKDPMCLH